jgi:hypothetical protein
MLILPRDMIDGKIEAVNTDVRNDILDTFILPFVACSLGMMFMISYILWKISFKITEPIIELQDKIK